MERKIPRQKIAIAADNSIPEELEKTLNRISARTSDRKEEVVDLLNGEQPAKSRMVESDYVSCTWWEGCYYCQDEQKQWHRVKCFM